jgi:hypothetical protein
MNEYAEINDKNTDNQTQPLHPALSRSTLEEMKRKNKNSIRNNSSNNRKSKIKDKTNYDF